MTEFAIKIIDLLKTWIGYLPDLSVENGILQHMVSGMDTVFEFLKQVNFFIPLDQMLIIIGLVYTIRCSKFLLFCINWVIRRLADLIP